MGNFNQYSSPIGFGFFHSGAEVYDCEYAYGGHNNPHTGVFEIAPKDVVSLGQESFKFRETIVIGYTDFEQQDVKQIVEQFGAKFRGDKYHLLHQNCNHFTDALVRVGNLGLGTFDHICMSTNLLYNPARNCAARVYPLG